MTEEALEAKIGELEDEVASLLKDRNYYADRADEYDSLSEAARDLVNALRERGDIANIAVFGLEIIEKIEAVEGLV
jgi:hypothetical protein